MVTNVTENIEIVFRPGRIMTRIENDDIAAIPCPDELHEDVHLYLIGALPEAIRDGIKGAEEFHRG